MNVWHARVTYARICIDTIILQKYFDGSPLEIDSFGCGSLNSAPRSATQRSTPRYTGMFLLLVALGRFSPSIPHQRLHVATQRTTPCPPLHQLPWHFLAPVPVWEAICSRGWHAEAEAVGSWQRLADAGYGWQRFASVVEGGRDWQHSVRRLAEVGRPS